MARLNTKSINTLKTHEGAMASHVNPVQALRRSVMACMLWEDSFYEDGQSISLHISELCKVVSMDELAKIAIEARTKFKLRHIPLLLVREMAKRGGSIVSGTLSEVIQRPDELSEFLAIYWENGREPLSSQVKKGLAKAFTKFNAYQLAKYNRDNKIKLKDVLFLCHAKPKDEAQEKLFKQLINDTLPIPYTWETELSSGADKKEAFTKLMQENALGGLAFIRNLRNMKQAGISKSLVAEYSQKANIDRILPFRFISAARAVPEWEDIIEQMMLRAMYNAEKLSGKTVIVVDNSGSMHGTRLSSRSDIDRSDAACALAILLREICEDIAIIGYGNGAKIIAPRHGFALADEIKKGPGGGTDTANALRLANNEGYDRVIVITDEQSRTTIGSPNGRGYFINVSIEKNGIGYGKWTHIDGFSEAVIEWIREYEAQK
jgi:60 kDa SS-A/Ro ribonucleoprotein